MAIKIKLSSSDAKKLAKECLETGDKYGLPRKKKKK
jgi:hypothetical protein